MRVNVGNIVSACASLGERSLNRASCPETLRVVGGDVVRIGGYASSGEFRVNVCAACRFELYHLMFYS